MKLITRELWNQVEKQTWAVMLDQIYYKNSIDGLVYDQTWNEISHQVTFRIWDEIHYQIRIKDKI